MDGALGTSMVCGTGAIMKPLFIPNETPQRGPYRRRDSTHRPLARGHVHDLLHHRVAQHLIQHSPDWFFRPSWPAGLYRVTQSQGLHVISGIASIPLLLAKLWSVFPKLFSMPLIHSLPHALERLSILVLSASAFFEVTTGLLNIAQNYRGISSSRKSTTRLPGSRSGPSRSTSRS
jgi:hypothetical protein